MVFSAALKNKRYAECCAWVSMVCVELVLQLPWKKKRFLWHFLSLLIPSKHMIYCDSSLKIGQDIRSSGSELMLQQQTASLEKGYTGDWGLTGVSCQGLWAEHLTDSLKVHKMFGLKAAFEVSFRLGGHHMLGISCQIISLKLCLLLKLVEWQGSFLPWSEAYIPQASNTSLCWNAAMQRLYDY